MEAGKKNTGDNKKYRAVFSDIDGTLLNSSHQVTPDTAREIQRLEAQGIPFVLVSARMPEAMFTIQAQAGISSPMVCYSGALVVGKDGEHLYSCHMDLEEAVKIKNMLDGEYPSICCNTYGGSKWLVDDDQNPWVMREESITTLKSSPGDVESTFAEAGGIHKFLLMGEGGEIMKVQERLHKDYPHLTVARSNEYYLEVMNGAVRKSVGVEFLCGHFGISMDQAIAFGDGHNDMDMLRAVKTSYAMANAPKEVQESASRITLDNDHEGLLAGLRECFGEDEN